ncbi:MAG: dephospho-CoA kinase [Acidobacteria bacterium]|nr:dephospho-CoA kinase [Acidobacteriota bacterium]
MLRVGLTGGIATGKSTVCDRLAEHGFRVIDADRVAHGLIRKGQPCFDPVVAAFGTRILDADGEIDRNILGQVVFNDPARLQELNALVHPEVIRSILEQLDRMEQSHPLSKAVVDASLMIEYGFHKQFKHLIVVSCGDDPQVERLMARNRLSRAQALQRIGLQWPLQAKLSLATFVIDNSGTLEHTRRQVDRLLETLEAEKASC